MTTLDFLAPHTQTRVISQPSQRPTKSIQKTPTGPPHSQLPMSPRIPPSKTNKYFCTENSKYRTLVY